MLRTQPEGSGPLLPSPCTGPCVIALWGSLGWEERKPQVVFWNVQTPTELCLAPSFSNPWRLPPFPWEGWGLPFLPGRPVLHPSHSCLQGVSLAALGQPIKGAHLSLGAGWCCQKSLGAASLGICRAWPRTEKRRWKGVRNLAGVWLPLLLALHPQSWARPGFCLWGQWKNGKYTWYVACRSSGGACRHGTIFRGVQSQGEGVTSRGTWPQGAQTLRGYSMTMRAQVKIRICSAKRLAETWKWEEGPRGSGGQRAAQVGRVWLGPGWV